MLASTRRACGFDWGRLLASAWAEEWRAAAVRRACCCVVRRELALAEGISQGYSRGTQVKDELSFKEVASIFVSLASFLKATIPYRLRTAEYPESPCLPP
jgi:hypothetical protein